MDERTQQTSLSEQPVLTSSFNIRMGIFHSNTKPKANSRNSIEKALQQEMDRQKIHYQPESLEKLEQSTAFTKKELKYLYQCFKQNCPSGYVSKAEFVTIFLSFFNITLKSDATAYAELVFNSFDDDDNGKISFSEFVSDLSMFIRGTDAEKLGWIFDLYDSKRRGYIVEEDLLNIARAMYAIVGVHYTKNKHIPVKTRRFFRKQFQDLDINHKGFIGKDDFIKSALGNKQMLCSLDVLKTVW